MAIQMIGLLKANTAGNGPQPMTCWELHCQTPISDSGRHVPEMLGEDSGDGAMEGRARGCIGGFSGSVSRPGRLVRQHLRIVAVPEHPLVALAHPRGRAAVVRLMPRVTALLILQSPTHWMKPTIR